MLVGTVRRGVKICLCVSFCFQYGLVRCDACFLCLIDGCVIALFCNQGCTECTHNTGNVGPDDLSAGDFLECTQHGIVVEGSALHDNVFAERGSTRDLDDFEQSIFDDGIGKAGGDIRDGCPLLLRLFDLGVHENGAAGAQIDRMLGEQSCLGKILYRIIE